MELRNYCSDSHHVVQAHTAPMAKQLLKQCVMFALLLTSLWVLPSLASAATTPTVVEQGIFDIPHARAEHCAVGSEVTTEAPGAVQSAAGDTALGLRTQQDGGQPVVHSDVVAQLWGTKCGTPVGGCWMMYPLPLGAPCCCLTPWGQVCGFVFP